MTNDAKGLFSVLTPYDQARENQLAETILGRLDEQISRLSFIRGPLIGLFKVPHEINGLEFKKRLVRFALARRISLESPEWEFSALHEAAREHPDLTPKKRRGRRPERTGQLSPLLFGYHDMEALKLVEDLDVINEIRQKHGEKGWSSRQLARKMAEAEGGPEHAVASNSQQYENRMSKARAALGRPKRPKKPV